MFPCEIDVDIWGSIANQYFLDDIQGWNGGALSPAPFSHGLIGQDFQTKI
jgi:hypothetical protein